MPRWSQRPLCKDVAWRRGLGALLVLTLPAWAPLLHPHFSLWKVFDGGLHLRRTLFLRELIADGNWYPRWLPQQFGGYGYPTLNFYAPGLYYLTLALAALLSLVRPQGAIYVAMQGASALGAWAAVAAPDGGRLGLGGFVDVRPLGLTAPDRPLRDAGVDGRRWLYLHPPAQVSLALEVPAEGYLQAGLALDPRAWEATLGDGVRFLATVRPLAPQEPGGATAEGGATGGAAEGGATTVVEVGLNPRARGEQRRWVDVVADLRPWAGRRVWLTLRTEGRADPAYDWAGWGEPAVVRLDPLTAARLRESARQTASLALRP